MTRRKGELTDRQIRRDWPHHVALPAERLRGVNNSMAIHGLVKELAGAPMAYHLKRGDSDLRVFCFKTAEAAQAFRDRFDGELLTT